MPQLLALPCTSVTVALLEVPQSRSAAHFWEVLRIEDPDTEGPVVLALSSERDSLAVTHLLVWRLERLWLHALKLRDASEAMKGEPYFKVEEPADDKGSTRCQVMGCIEVGLKRHESLGQLSKLGLSNGSFENALR